MASVICIDLWPADGAGTAATCNMHSWLPTSNLQRATCTAATMERCQGGSDTLPLLMCLRRHSIRCRSIQGSCHVTYIQLNALECRRTTTPPPPFGHHGPRLFRSCLLASECLRRQRWPREQWAADK